MEIDHIIAKSKGGTDHIENLQLLCSNCNTIKGDRGQEYLLSRLAGLSYNRTSHTKGTTKKHMEGNDIEYDFQYLVMGDGADGTRFKLTAYQDKDEPSVGTIELLLANGCMYGTVTVDSYSSHPTLDRACLKLAEKWASAFQAVTISIGFEGFKPQPDAYEDLGYKLDTMISEDIDLSNFHQNTLRFSKNL